MKGMKPVKRLSALLLCLVLCVSALPALSEKYDATPAIFDVEYQTKERKEDGGRYFISKEYLITTSDKVNAELQAVADGFDEQLFPTMQPDPKKNGRRNSRLDIEALHYITGESCLSTMVLARVTFERHQLCSPFWTGTYDLATGEKIALTDLFAQDSAAWEMMAQRVESHLGGLFPQLERNPEAVSALCTREALEDAGFTLSGYELTLHYEAAQVYEGQAGLMHVRFFYDELRPHMTELGLRHTDNSRWKMVAFTCDDGPSYGPTQNTLTNFRQGGARVTYFTVGKRVAGNPDLVMREFDQNHIIASHSYNHWSGYTMKPETMRQELADHNALLQQYTGEAVTLFRAPGGSFPPWVEADIHLPILQWSLDTYDYTGKAADKIFYSLRNNVADGDMVLCHDSGENLHKAIPRMTDYLKKNGYLMVTVEELARANGIIMQPNEVYYRFIDGDYSKRPDSNL